MSEKPPAVNLPPKNFVAHLSALARARADEPWLTVVASVDGTERETTLGYGALERRVRALAARLQQRFARGERALIMLDNGVAYVVGMLGCFYAGIVAVPVFPPESNRPQHLARLAGIADDSQACCVLTSTAIAQALREGAAGAFDQAEFIAVDAVDDALADAWTHAEPAPSDVAFLQYTSGSTSAPKGVMVTHGSLMANEAAIRHAMAVGPGDRFVCWAPLFHDMGLIGGMLQPLYAGVPLVLVTPGYFLERPVRWLELIARHRATHSGGPDFSYRLCLDRVNDARLAQLDLSSWRVAYTGAEPVREDTMREFIARFSAAGFDARAVYPCYGLAEGTLFVTGGVRGGGMVANAFAADDLARGIATPRAGGTMLVGCGQPAPGQRVEIVDHASRERVPANHVGEIWSQGPSICAGYWNKAKETQQTFVEHQGGRWLRTGDLGFLHAGQLYVTGRLKDLIIVRGHNIYPQDVERRIEDEVDAVRKSRVAVFAVQGAQGEGIGVAAEVSRGMQKLVPAQALVDALGAAVAETFGEPLSVVLLLNPGGLPKTTSGKLQRSACRTLWREGTADAYAVWQFGGFVRGGAVPEAAHGAALDDTEEAVAAIWRAVWKHRGAPDALAPEAHFFNLGGNSLTAAQAAARIAAKWQIDFGARTLFEHPRLRACAAHVRSLQAQGARRPTAPMQVLPAERRLLPLPLSHAQERQWFLWQLDPKSAAYHVSSAWRLRGTLRVDALQAALDALVAAHEPLRTVFGDTLADGSVAQRILPAMALPLVQVDVRRADGDEGARAAEAATRRLVAEPFDLTQGPLLRVGVLRVADDAHLLVIVMHHIVSDGASMQRFIDQLAAHYAAPHAAAASQHPRIQYADHAVWQRTWLAAGEGERQLAWWRGQLGDAQSVLELRTDRPRRPEAGYSAARHAFVLPPVLLGGLQQVAQRHGATRFMALLAGFQALLHRASGQQDICIGVPVANRQRVETEDMLGLFVNTLVLRNTVHGRLAASQVLAQARDAVLGAQAHQDVPFEQVVQMLQPGRSLSHTPLFQVMFNHLVEDHAALGAMPGLAVEPHALPDLAAQFELTLEARERRGGAVSLAFIYAAELFAPETIARMAGHYLALLQALVTMPEMCVGDVPLLTPAEHAELDAWGVNPRREPGASATPVHHRIAQQASRQPDATALLFGDEALRYAELERRANRLAHHLIARGVRPEERVGIAMQRSSELIVAILGVLKAGAAYVPLDPDYPAERLAYIAEDSAIALLLTHGPTRGCIPEGGFTVLEVDSLDLASEPATDPQVPVHGEHLAYVIYTSGSTGRPKGAAIRHAALASCMAWMQHTYGIGGEDTVLHKAPFGFDVSCWEIFWPLTAGARLVVAHPGDQRDPARLIALIRRHQVTTLNFVPAMLKAFLAHEGIEAHTRLRHIICGGEAMPAETQRETLRRLQGATLQNLYGPTETTIHVTQWTCRDDGEPLVPIGRPISHTSAHVLDAELQRVPRGVAGELYLGGVSLARGYLNRPGLTAERFVADPLDAEGKGGRLYRTGDLVRWNAEGQIEYLGRIDHQVKIRGLRIELGEIEAQLLAQPGVREAVVVAREAAPTGARLIAYLSAHAGAPLDAQALKQSLAQSLPDYMVPRAFVVLDALPLNANGKVDRSALPAVAAPQATDYAAPQGHIAQTIAAVWSEVLQVPQVGRHDNFFDLGGHSLLLIRAHRLLEARLQAEIPMVQLFKHPTVDALARALDPAPATASAVAASAATGDDRALRQRAAMLQRRKAAERIH